MADKPPVNQSDADAAQAVPRDSVLRRYAESARSLPLEAEVQPFNGGWWVRLPVRAEQITIDKEVVVSEEVTLRTKQVEDVVRVEDTVRREELRVDSEGDVEVRQP